jgi:hypothetical protein
MAITKAKLVDAAAFGDKGPGVSATFARTEFEQALNAGQGPVELQLEVRASGPDVEAHTLDIALDRPEVEKLLESEGDAIRLTFDPTELESALDDDVEAHNVRERALVLTVAAVTAATGAGAMLVSQQAANMSSSHTTAVQTGYLTPAAAEALSASTQPISDAASGGGYAGTDQTDAVSRYLGNTATPERVAGESVGTAVSESPGRAAATTQAGGYLTSASAEALGASTQPISDAASGSGYAQPDQGDAVSRYLGNTTDGGYLTSASAEALGTSTQPISDAASGGGYTSVPEQVSDAATGGYVQADQSDAVSRYLGNTATPEQVSDAASGGGYTAPAGGGGYLTSSSAAALDASMQPISDAATGGYTPAGPEQVSDAASGGGYSVQAEAQSPGINLPEAAGAAIAGGIALLITGAAVRRKVQ